MTEPVRCRLVIAPDGLPQRTEAVLRRERGRLPAYIERLEGGFGKGEPDDDPSPPTVDDLVTALEARDPITLGVAAFLAGRCRAVDADASARLDRALRDLASTPVEALDLLAEGYVEAALSLALRGDPSAGRAALLPVIDNAGSADWLAAAALAQMGDPSGWPMLLRDLREGIDHVRLMAARQLLMFVPYDGHEVGGGKVDVGGELRRLADDPSEWIRDEVPALLEEAGFPP